MHIFQKELGDKSFFRASKGFKPVPVALAALALSAIPQILLVAMSRHLPIPLLVLLVAVALSCIAVAAISLEELVSTEVIVGPDDLTWNSLLSSRTVAWHQITETELRAVDGSLATTSLDTGARAVGVEVTIMSPLPTKPEERVLLLVGSAAAAPQMRHMVEAMKAARRQTKAGVQPHRGRRIAKPVMPTGEFRRRPTSHPRADDYQSNSLAG